jgi:hypothetical protein
MRLSWYSDTGIAVFSIWQGGTCTGTFRLPMDDLSRLMDSLHRGMPGGQDEPPELSQAVEGPRQRLAIGAAPEPYTGALIALRATPLSQPGSTAEARVAAPGAAAGPGYGPGYGESAYPGDGRDQRRYADQQAIGDPHSYPGAQGYGEQPGYDGHQGYTDASHTYPADASSFGLAPAPANGQGPGDGRGYEDRRDFDGRPGYADWQDTGAGQSYPAGQAYGPDPSYEQQRPYGDGQGFIPAGYDAQGYAMPGYAEQVPTGPDYPDSGFGNRGYGLQEPTPQAYPQVLSAPVEPAPADRGQFTGPGPAAANSLPAGPPPSRSAGQA